MQIIVTGGAGFVGVELVRRLVSANNHVIIVDKGLYGLAALKSLSDDGLHDYEVYNQSIKDFIALNKITEEVVGVDAIIHLAGLSNDPLADFDPVANMELNFEETKRIVDFAIQQKIPRFVFASSAAVYGFSDSVLMTEQMNVYPQSNYAKSKLAAEDYIIKACESTDTRYIVLRKGTIMGTSVRMRFDLCVNTMIKDVITKEKIELYGGGETWRPMVDLRDVIDVYSFFVQVDDDKYLSCSNSIYNVVGKNYRIAELGIRIGHHFGVDVVPIYDMPADVRSYRISGYKLETTMKRKLDRQIGETVNDIMKWITHNKPDFNDPIYYNIKWIKNCEKVHKSFGIPFKLY